jgi:hypothetical protein
VREIFRRIAGQRALKKVGDLRSRGANGQLMVGIQGQTQLEVNLIARRVIFLKSDSTAETGGEICLGIETEYIVHAALCLQSGRDLPFGISVWFHLPL